MARRNTIRPLVFRRCSRRQRRVDHSRSSTLRAATRTRRHPLPRGTGFSRGAVRSGKKNPLLRRRRLPVPSLPQRRMPRHPRGIFRTVRVRHYRHRQTAGQYSPRAGGERLHHAGAGFFRWRCRWRQDLCRHRSRLRRSGGRMASLPRGDGYLAGCEGGRTRPSRHHRHLCPSPRLARRGGNRGDRGELRRQPAGGSIIARLDPRPKFPRASPRRPSAPGPRPLGPRLRRPGKK